MAYWNIEMRQKIRRRLFVDKDIVRMRYNGEIIKLFIRMQDQRIIKNKETILEENKSSFNRDYECKKDEILEECKLIFSRGHEYKKEQILEQCKQLFSRDYECKYVDGVFSNSGNHPKQVVIPIAEKDPDERRERMNFEALQYRTQIENHSNGGRFPCPVILFKGKYVCRSGRPTVLQYDPGLDIRNIKKRSDLRKPKVPKETQIQRFATIDADFLKSIDVTSICNMALEFNFHGIVSVSETLTEIYRGIYIFNLPLQRQELLHLRRDPENITKAYLKILLEFLITKKGGFLVQTWDGRHRAALFTSLLRLSLWADGVIHTSLSMEEIAFLTLAYDWYLFGFRVRDELALDMLAFFITILELISTNEFSIIRMYENTPPDKRIPITFPRFSGSRREVLKQLSDILLQSFEKSVHYISVFLDCVASNARKM